MSNGSGRAVARRSGLMGGDDFSPTLRAFFSLSSGTSIYSTSNTYLPYIRAFIIKPFNTIIF